jgi:hypothetical protein
MKCSFTAGAAEFISGVIMQDETIRQNSPDGGQEDRAAAYAARICFSKRTGRRSAGRGRLRGLLRRTKSAMARSVSAASLLL